MPKLTWEEGRKNKARRGKVQRKKNVGSFWEYLFKGAPVSERVPKSKYLWDEDIFGDELNADTLGMVYTSAVASIHEIKLLEPIWSLDVVLKQEQETKDLLSLLCGVEEPSSATSFWSCHWLTTKLSFGQKSEYNLCLFVSIKFPETILPKEKRASPEANAARYVEAREKHESKIHAVLRAANQVRYSSNERTELNHPYWGQRFVFPLSKKAHKKGNLVVKFMDETETINEQWFATEFRRKSVGLIGENKLRLSILDIPYAMLGEETDHFGKALKGTSKSVSYKDPGRRGSMSRASSPTFSPTDPQKPTSREKDIFVTKFKIRVNSNVAPQVGPKGREEEAHLSTLLAKDSSYFWSRFRPKDKEVVNKYNIKYVVPIELRLHLGFSWSLQQREKSIKTHFLLYRLIILTKSGRSARNGYSTRKNLDLDLKSLKWTSWEEVGGDEVFVQLMKNHSIVNDINIGEDAASRVMALYACIKYNGMDRFDPRFVGDLLSRLIKYKIQLDSLPESTFIALTTALAGILYYFLDNVLKKIQYTFDDNLKVIIKDWDEHEKEVTVRKRWQRIIDKQLKEPEEVVERVTSKIQSGPQAAGSGRIPPECIDRTKLSAKLIESLKCVHQVITLSSYEKGMKETFERHLQQSAIRWFKVQFMSTERTLIAEGLHQFLGHLQVGNTYFEEAKLYSTYTAMMSNVICVVVDEAKRVIDYQTIYSGPKPKIVYPSREDAELVNIYRHLNNLNSFIENSTNENEVKELWFNIRQIKQHLPFTVAAKLIKDTKPIIEKVTLKEETLTPTDVSANKLHSTLTAALMAKIGQAIVLCKDDIHLSSSLVGKELTKAITLICNEYCDQLKRKVEEARYYINFVEGGVGPELFVALNSLHAVALFLVGPDCSLKLQDAVTRVTITKGINTQFLNLQNKYETLAKTIFFVVLKTMSGILSQNLLYIYIDLKREHYFASTKNSICMLAFQIKQKVNDKELKKRRLIELWSEFLYIYQVFFGSFLFGEVKPSADGDASLRNLLVETKEALVTALGVTDEVIDHAIPFEELLATFKSAPDPPSKPQSQRQIDQKGQNSQLQPQHGQEKTFQPIYHPPSDESLLDGSASGTSEKKKL